MPKRKRLITVFGALIFSIFFIVNFISQQYVVPILMYHSVNPNARPENRLVVSVNSFERQMQFLKEHRYNVVPLEVLINLIKEKKRTPRNTVVITLDDGYRDNYIYAFPILKKYNLPATVFVIIDEIGRAQGDRLSWDEIKIMQDSGLITVGSHALGPEPLINIKSGEELIKQVFDSKRILEERLDQTINAFSYPEGRFNDKIKQLVIDAGYKIAVATNPGKKFSNRDIFALKRLRVSSTADNLFVFWIQASGFYNFIREHRRK
jgi:peptidoglycan/xylan/chitin deacetylase (PgdA/CDA1 family)